MTWDIKPPLSSPSPSKTSLQRASSSSTCLLTLADVIAVSPTAAANNNPTPTLAVLAAAASPASEIKDAMASSKKGGRVGKDYRRIGLQSYPLRVFSVMRAWLLGDNIYPFFFEYPYLRASLALLLVCLCVCDLALTDSVLLEFYCAWSSGRICSNHLAAILPLVSYLSVCL